MTEDIGYGMEESWLHASLSEPRIPTDSPIVYRVGSSTIPSLLDLYDKLMMEILNDTSEDKTKLIDEVIRRLEIKFAEESYFMDKNTELWFNGVNSTIITTDTFAMEDLVESAYAEPNPDDDHDGIGYIVSGEDSIQCFFDGFYIGQAPNLNSVESDAVIPYALGVRVSNIMITPTMPGENKIYLPGQSLIIPERFEGLNLGIVDRQ